MYVSPNGADSNPGTLEQPFRTVQKAIDTLQPGQTALLRGGNYNRAECVGATDSGSASGGHVTLKAYPGETPVLSASSDGVLYIDCDYLRVEGLTIRGPGNVGGTLVYGVGGSDHIQLVGNEVTGSVCQGIYTEDTTANYEILRNRIHDNGTSACDRQAHGIYLEGNNHLVANNLIYNHPEGFGIQHYPQGNNARIIGNTITHSGHGGIVIGGSRGVSGATVVNNIVAHNGSYGIDRDSSAPSSCSIHHNLAYANGTANYDSGWPAGCLGTNLAGNPLFLDLAARNLAVQATSPAVNAGDPNNTISPAYDGTTRPIGNAPDIGAHER